MKIYLLHDNVSFLCRSVMTVFLVHVLIHMLSVISEKTYALRENAFCFYCVQNYTAGNPSLVLYIKNLAKDVVIDDFYYIFGKK